MSNVTEALEFMKNEKVSIVDAATSIQYLCSDIIAIDPIKWCYRYPPRATDEFAYFAFYFDDNDKFHCYSNANIDVIELRGYDIATIARRVSKLRFKHQKCGRAEIEALNRFFGREFFKYNEETGESPYGWYRDSVIDNSYLFNKDKDGYEIPIIYYAGSKERDIIP